MTTLMPWNPFRELTSWHKDIDELFNRLIGSSPFEMEREEMAMMPGWLPAAESFTKDGTHIVRLDLPGVDPKDLDVSVVNDMLVISGQRKTSEEVKEKNYQYREIGYGKFERRLALPKGVEGDKIKATYKNGVLELLIPLPVELAGKKIPILIEEGQTKKLAA